MSVSTYALLADAALADVRKPLEAAAAAWSRAWGVDAPAVACRRAWEAPALTGCRTQASSAGGAVWMGWPDALPAALQRMMFAPDRDVARAADAELAPAAALAALEALRAALLQATLNLDYSRADAATVPAALRSPGSGAVLAEVRFERQAIGLLLEHGVVERLSSTPDVSHTPLAPADYRALLAGQPVRLAVEAGRASVSVGSLVALAPGDVIRLDTLADHPLGAATADGAVLLRGYLGTRDHYLALDLAAGDVPSGEQA